MLTIRSSCSRWRLQRSARAVARASPGRRAAGLVIFPGDPAAPGMMCPPVVKTGSRVRSAACARDPVVLDADGVRRQRKPTAAMLQNDGVGQRSGVRPLPGGVRSQKKLNVRCCRVSRNAAVSGATPGPPELPAQPPRARAKTTAENASAVTDQKPYSAATCNRRASLFTQCASPKFATSVRSLVL